MRMRCGLLLVALVGLSVPSSAAAKGFNRVVVIGADHRSVELRGSESVLGWADSTPGRRLRGGYLRLFYIGPGDFPANPARYYPETGCIALDWPTFETTCRPASTRQKRLLSRTRGLPLFREPPTHVSRIGYLGSKDAFSGQLKGPGALKDPIELALDRTSRAAAKPRHCFAFRVTWRGPQSAERPRRLFLCASGVYTQGRIHPLRSGVWRWFALNTGQIAGGG
jgi:hypothetical protein